MNSACCVYAIVRRGTRPPAGRIATHAADLALVPCRELAAVVERIGDGGAGPAPTIEAVLRHEAIVESVRQQRRAIPVRFGTVFRDAASVTQAIAERYDALQADLDRLGDKVELSLTALWAGLPADDDAAAPGANGANAAQGAGARYLRERAAECRREDALRERARVVVDRLDQILGPRALDRCVLLLPRPGVAVRTAYLVDPAEVRAVRMAFEATRRSQGDVRLLLTGPWPPYSFVRRADTDREAACDGPLLEIANILTDAMRPTSRPTGRHAEINNSG